MGVVDGDEVIDIRKDGGGAEPLGQSAGELERRSGARADGENDAGSGDAGLADEVLALCHGVVELVQQEVGVGDGNVLVGPVVVGLPVAVAGLPVDRLRRAGTEVAMEEAGVVVIGADSLLRFLHQPLGGELPAGEKVGLQHLLVGGVHDVGEEGVGIDDQYIRLEAVSGHHLLRHRAVAAHAEAEYIVVNAGLAEKVAHRRGGEGVLRAAVAEEQDPGPFDRSDGDGVGRVPVCPVFIVAIAGRVTVGHEVSAIVAVGVALLDARQDVPALEQDDGERNEQIADGEDDEESAVALFHA